MVATALRGQLLEYLALFRQQIVATIVSWNLQDDIFGVISGLVDVAKITGANAIYRPIWTSSTVPD